MDKDREVDDIIDPTDDSESSSSSSNIGVFEAHRPFVLELHDIRKDDPMLAESVQPVAKKKHKKKKKGQPVREKSSSSISSDSLSEASSVAASASEGKEEFYDAHESYHTISEGPVVAAAKMQAHSETSQNPKSISQSIAASDQQTTTSSRKEPSTVTKPSIPPE